MTNTPNHENFMEAMIAKLLEKHLAPMRGKPPGEVADALLAALQEAAVMCGQSKSEAFMRKPGEPRHFDNTKCWVVAWEGGPFDWAIPASFHVMALTGRLIEPYYGFDLCIYPDE